MSMAVHVKLLVFVVISMAPHLHMYVLTVSDGSQTVLQHCLRLAQSPLVMSEAAVLTSRIASSVILVVPPRLFRTGRWTVLLPM